MRIIALYKIKGFINDDARPSVNILCPRLNVFEHHVSHPKVVIGIIFALERNEQNGDLVFSLNLNLKFIF